MIGNGYCIWLYMLTPSICHFFTTRMSVAHMLGLKSHSEQSFGEIWRITKFSDMTGMPKFNSIGILQLDSTGGWFFTHFQDVAVVVRRYRHGPVVRGMPKVWWMKVCFKMFQITTYYFRLKHDISPTWDFPFKSKGRSYFPLAKQTEMEWHLVTSPPEKLPGPQKERIVFWTIIFQGVLLLNFGGVYTNT